jgi:hypothetical protein
MEETTLIYKVESYAIMGACFEVVNFGHFPLVEYERIAL